MISVEEICRARRMTIAELAAGANLELSRIAAIIEGRWTSSPAERERIAAALGVSANEIAWGHKTPVLHLYGHGNPE